MKKLILSFNIIYGSIGATSIFRLTGISILVSLILTFYILSIQFLWMTSI